MTQSLFMRQTLEADASCQKAVNGWAAQQVRDGLSACSVRTGAYCVYLPDPRVREQWLDAYQRAAAQRGSQRAAA